MAVSSTNRVLNRFSSMSRGPLRHLSPVTTSMEGMDYIVFALTVSAASYVVYNVLFLAAQLWAAFATLILGAYYFLLFYGRINKKNTMFMVGVGIQGLVTLILFGLFLFFVAEIFIYHSSVYEVFPYYTKHMNDENRDKVARLTSAGMALDSLVTAALHLWALVLSCIDMRVDAVKRDARFEAVAIHTDPYYPEGRGGKSNSPYGTKPTYTDPYGSRGDASRAPYGAVTTHTDPHFTKGGTSDAPYGATNADLYTYIDPYFLEERRSSPHEAYRDVTQEERSQARDSMLAHLGESKYDSMNRSGLPRFQWSSSGSSGGLQAKKRVEPYQSKPSSSYY